MFVEPQEFFSTKTKIRSGIERRRLLHFLFNRTGIAGFPVVKETNFFTFYELDEG